MVPAYKNNLIKEELSVTEGNACLDATPDFPSDRTLVARVCRDPGFCDGSACIRKCCAENEFFYATGCNKLAVPEEPMDFHAALANAVNQTESSTFDTTKGFSLMRLKRSCCFLRKKFNFFI